MPQVVLSELIAVPVESFRRGTRDISFDVYLKLSDDNIAHVFSRTTGLDYKRLSNYIQKGVTHLHIREDDREAYKAFIARTPESILNNPSATSEKKIAALLNMTEQNMAEIFSQMDVREETIAETQRVVTGYVDMMTHNPQSLAILLRLASHGEYLYYHSVAVSVFSLFIAKATGQFNQKLSELVGMGGFLHDIGCVKLPEGLLNSTDAYDDSQWAMMKEHPRMSLDMLREAKNIPDEVRHIVYQHHEEPRGSGYPNGISGPAIYYPARIVALADGFSALISKRPHRPAYTSEEAMDILAKEKNKYDPDLVAILAAILGQGRLKKAS